MCSTALQAFRAASLVSLAPNVKVTTLRSPHPQVGVNFFNDFGRSVSGACDVDQDGTPDVVVGAPSEGFNGGGFGRPYVSSLTTAR